ncbi:MAG: MBL fold metallo-hydrolase [Alphaproteobacteria bacterium]|nr:MBL fold metallo-hydrolase [Alphaproteobacteria bacterium]
MTGKFITPNRREFIGGTAALCAATALPFPAFASNKIKLGEFEVTTFSDGYITLPTTGVAPKADPAARAAALAKAGLTGETRKSPINVTLIKTPDDVILVDAGSGPNFVPTTGKLEEALGEADVDVESITKVIFTHAHPDHIWGVVNDFDELTFPEATYYVAEKEFAFWNEPDVAKKLREDREFFAVGAKSRFKAIEEKIKFVKDDDEVVSGINIMETNGHTQGHLSVEVKSGSETLVVLGDALTNPVVSFEHPEWQPESDQVPDQAIATRKRLLDQLHSMKAKIIGYHLPPPGIGMVVKKGNGFAYEALG